MKFGPQSVFELKDDNAERRNGSLDAMSLGARNADHDSNTGQNDLLEPAKRAEPSLNSVRSQVKVGSICADTRFKRLQH
jgi:hypothetical protein